MKTALFLSLFSVASGFTQGVGDRIEAPPISSIGKYAFSHLEEDWKGELLTGFDFILSKEMDFEMVEGRSWSRCAKEEPQRRSPLVLLRVTQGLDFGPHSPWQDALVTGKILFTDRLCIRPQVLTLVSKTGKRIDVEMAASSLLTLKKKGKKNLFQLIDRGSERIYYVPPRTEMVSTQLCAQRQTNTTRS